MRLAGGRWLITTPGMDVSKHELAWKQERKWLFRTVFALVLLVICFFGFLGTFVWINHHYSSLWRASSAAPASRPEILVQEYLQFFQKVSIAFVISLGIASLGFLFSLIRWLSAIHARRK